MAAWSDEDKAELRRLAAEGLSATQIGATFDPPRSRNAVIGICHRTKPRIELKGMSIIPPGPDWKREKAPKPAKPRPAIAATRKRHAAPKQIYQPPIQPEFESEPLPEVEELFIPENKRLNLLQLTEHTCKWPIGDPLTKDFYFCGHHSLSTGPYCEFHARRAFRQAEPIRIKGKKK